MQSGYGASEIHHHHHHHQQQQHHHHLIDDDGDDDTCSNPSAFLITNPQNNNHLNHHPQQHLQRRKHPQQRRQQQQQQMFQQLPPPPPPPPSSYFTTTHQFLSPFHIFHQPQQQQQQLGLEVQAPCPTLNPFFDDVNFKEDSGNKDEQQHHRSLVMPSHGWHYSQEDSSAIIQLQHQPSCNADKEAETEIERECIKNNYKELYSSHVMGTNKYKHFGGELEEICSLANAKTNNNVETNDQIIMGSGSADVVGVDLDHGSENSLGDEASLGKVHEKKKKKRKRKMKRKLSSMVVYFERLVKQIMDHQEGLHRKFLEVVQRMDRERVERDEAWRCEEAAKYIKEANAARSNEQAIASLREAMIISYIEKITGQSINLPPTRSADVSSPPHEPEVAKEPTKELKSSDMNSCSRWPKSEVEALIRVRGSLDWRFSEPGLKGPLWEEVSALMASMGYQRSAKRCKEKWENINKYFRKTKESGKKRPLESKTCPYYHQLDQFHSRNNMISLPSNPDMGLSNQGYSELLQACVAARDLGNNANNTVQFGQGSHGDEKENNQEDEDDTDADKNGDYNN